LVRKTSSLAQNAVSKLNIETCLALFTRTCGTPGDIMSDYRATSSRNARATSSESASAYEGQSIVRRAEAAHIKDHHALLTFYDFPAEHWKHLRTTNVRKGFATIRRQSG
jgi:hypothetical protein